VRLVTTSPYSGQCIDAQNCSRVAGAKSVIDQDELPDEVTMLRISIGNFLKGTSFDYDTNVYVNKKTSFGPGDSKEVLWQLCVCRQEGQREKRKKGDVREGPKNIKWDRTKRDW